jgi:hypothetical protein
VHHRDIFGPPIGRLGKAFSGGIGTNYAGVAEEILSTGYARVRFSGRELETLVDLRRKATDFFRRSEAEKRMYGSEDFNFWLPALRQAVLDHAHGVRHVRVICLLVR